MNTSILQYLSCQNTQAQHEVLKYFEQLKESDTGWRHTVAAVTSGEYDNDDQIKFFCLQVVEHYLKTRYQHAPVEDQVDARKFLMYWLDMHCRDGGKQKGFLCNKAAQLFSLAFVVDFPTRWPSFIRDLLSTLSAGHAAVDMYLRTLLAIDSEVVDREIPHTPQEIERNTALKDALRVESVQLMVDSWYHIITTYRQTDAALACQCLQVVGAYISWIELSLVVNERWVRLLLELLGEPLIRESTCDCMLEIVLKGMDPGAKTKLVQEFWALLETTGVFKLDEDEDGDFLVKLGKLVNGMGLQLILSWQRLSKAKETVAAQEALSALEEKLSVMLQFLGNEDDDVSGAVAPLAHDYLTLLKQLPTVSEQQKNTVKKLLYTIVGKLRYDDSYTWENEGEEEAMFDEYRKELRVLLNNIGALDNDLLLSAVKEIVSETLNSWQSRPYQEVEVALALLYQLAEALPVSVGQQFSSDENKISSLQEMMRLVVTSNVSYQGHLAVTRQFFEVVVRYDKFFNSEPQHIAPVLMAFLDERGLRNLSAHVRSRAAYLFSRFVKEVSKHHLQGCVEEILGRVSELLALHSPDNGVKHYLSGDDQLFMYETTGVLIIQSAFAPEKKQELMKQLLAPICTKFDSLLQGLGAATDEQRQQAYCDSLTQAMALASRSSKGFSTQQTMKVCGCVEAYTETLGIFIHALDTPVHRQTLHAGVRQFLHRLVVCLEDEVLPFIPIAMEKLLKNPDTKELYDFLPLLNQVVAKFKKRLTPFLTEVFMPVVRTVFRVLSAPSDERDTVAQTERRLLQRGYFAFLSSLVASGATDVFTNQEPANLQQVVLTLVEGAVELPDPQSQKACFTVLRKLTEAWADPAHLLPGYCEFMYKHVLPACFMAPLKPDFDLNDAQTCLALNECASCLKTMHILRGDELIQYLQNDYFPSMQMPPENSQEFCEALKADSKVFKQYFKSFFVRAKS